MPASSSTLFYISEHRKIFAYFSVAFFFLFLSPLVSKLVSCIHVFFNLSGERTNLVSLFSFLGSNQIFLFFIYGQDTPDHSCDKKIVETVEDTFAWLQQPALGSQQLLQAGPGSRWQIERGVFSCNLGRMWYQ